MYAVIRIGTSQERVTEGQIVRVDLRKEDVGRTHRGRFPQTLGDGRHLDADLHPHARLLDLLSTVAESDVIAPESVE